MRLTLRTMLAYMDEILEPKDAQDIGEKIEDSETASALLHRTRDVMRRLRLKAPELTEHGGGLDPNTVAEYLDNTLSDDRVPDFEKVCLESDMHLAEVASCHQILALVLGEPAEVDPASREHMYQLPQVLSEQAAMEARAAEEDSGGDGEPEGRQRRKPQRPKPTVPDYLREPPPRRRRLLSVAALLVLVGCLGVVFLGVTGQLDLLGLNAGAEDQQVAQQLARDSEPHEEAGGPPEDSQSTPPEPVEPVPSEPSGPGEPAAAAPGVPPSTTQQPSEQSPDGSSPPVEPVAPPEQADDDATVGPSEEPPAAPGEPVEPGPEPGPGGPPRIEPVKLPGPEPPAVEPPEEPPAPVPPERLGRFISDNQVLLQFDAGSATWKAVPPQGILTPQYELLALPTFRPLMAMTAGVTVHLMGGTQVKLQPTNEQGIPGLSVAFGRFMVRTVGKTGRQMLLTVGGRSGLITFSGTDSAMAVEVTRQLLRGADPETQPAIVTVDLYALGGRLLWQEGSQGEAETIDAPGRRRLSGPAPNAEQEAAAEKLPEWVFADTAGLLDRRASAVLRQSLAGDRPVSLALRELADERQREVRRLATRCLGYIGQFDLMVAALNDPYQRPLWSDYIEYLQAAISRGPQAAMTVRKAFEKNYPEDAPELFRLLCGFTQQQLENGQDATLVEYLDHQMLAFRMLSFWNLKGITGAGLYYQPEASAAKRQQSVRKWKQRQEAGQIRFAARRTGSHSPPPAVKPAPPKGGNQ